MSEEKKIVLDMLNQGKISVQEAQSLLEALAKSDPPRRPDFPPVPPHPEPASLVGDIVETIRSGLSNINFSFGDANRIVFEERHSGRFTGEKVDLDLEARNGSIRVENWDQDDFRLEIVKRIKATTREQAEEMVSGYRFAEFDGNNLRAGDHECKSISNRVSVSVRLWLPRSHVYHGRAASKNGSVEVNGIDVSGFDVSTMNGSIKLSKVNGDQITAGTVNGSLRLEGGLGRVEGKTTNGSITLVNMAEESDSRLETVNGRIKVQLPVRHDIGISVDARTTSGGVRLEHPVLDTRFEERRVTGGRSVHANTANWKTAEHRIELHLRSVNGSIRIEELE
jgi:DUF4097 and DUF4098 domain-containing protein YvlB